MTMRQAKSDTSRRTVLGAIAMLFPAIRASYAQGPEPQRPSDDTEPRGAPPLEPDDQDQTESLGERRRKRNGVIDPNGDTDPGIEIRPPADPGTTPVIPPNRDPDTAPK